MKPLTISADKKSAFSGKSAVMAYKAITIPYRAVLGSQPGQKGMDTDMKKVLDGLGYSFTILSHPIRGFYELRFENKGNLFSCVLLLTLMLAALTCQSVYTGLSFAVTNIKEFNILRQAANVLVPVMLWCVANWSITVLMDGEGRFRDIFMATCYATMPYTVTTFVNVLLSRILTAEEATFVNILATVGVILSLLLLFSGMVTIHQFSVRQAVFVLFMTVAAMVFIAFLAVLFLSIVDDMLSYIRGIAVELQLRR